MLTYRALCKDCSCMGLIDKPIGQKELHERVCILKVLLSLLHQAYPLEAARHVELKGTLDVAYFQILNKKEFLKQSPPMNSFDDSKEGYTGVMDIRAAMTGSIPGDRPLMEELGIDLHTIKTESLLPVKVLQNAENIARASTDLTGPILILIMLTFTLVVQGKLHFGYIYLISLSSSFLICLLLNLLTPKSISFMLCCNIMGYSLAPVVAFSVVNILLVWTGMSIRLFIGIVMGAWSAYTASVMFCKHLETHDKLVVVGYPLFLAYACFIIMIIF